MQIELEDIGKKFGKGFVFRHLNKQIQSGSRLGIVGSNGSGKSTLLQIIAGLQIPSEGLVHRQVEEKLLYKRISFCSPALGLYEDFTLKEHIQFYSELKPLSVSLEECLELMQLDKHKDKQIKHFSSGMKQRVKLGLAIYAHTDVLFLDEPCSHLDKKSEEWYANALGKCNAERTIIVASNDHDSELLHTTERWNFNLI
ncbi:MAG: ATP-binding cassette domain-containing protein [Bacteroidota bacterium]